MTEPIDRTGESGRQWAEIYGAAATLALIAYILGWRCPCPFHRRKRRHG